MSSASFDWKSIQKYFTPQAADDLTRFMDTLPVYAGKGALVAAGIAWAAAAALGLFTVVQTKNLTEMRASLQTSNALKPLVPTISTTPVGRDDINTLVDRYKTVYPDLSVTVIGSDLAIRSKQTSHYTEFREALGHTVNGGKGWKVSVESLCVGRECKQGGLDALIKVQKLKIDKPSS